MGAFFVRDNCDSRLQETDSYEVTSIRRKLQRTSKREPAFVFDEEAGVLDNEEAGGVGFGGGFSVRNSLLEPERCGMDGNGGIGDGGNVLGAAKDVDNVDRAWNILEASVGFFTEDFGLVGIDGDDSVAGALEVGSDLMGRAARVGGESDNGDGFGGAEEIEDGIRRWRGVIRDLNEHVDWMSLGGKRVNQKVAV